MARGRVNVQKEHFEEPTINLTPLIDVVFVILIMFILVAPLVELDLIELADSSPSPMSSSKAVQESSLIAIHVHKDNTVWFNNHQVSVNQLIDQLKQAKARHPKSNPQLFHDRRAQFGVYQSVKNAAEEAGFAELEVILKPS